MNTLLTTMYEVLVVTVPVTLLEQWTLLLVTSGMLALVNVLVITVIVATRGMLMLVMTCAA